MPGTAYRNQRHVCPAILFTLLALTSVLQAQQPWTQPPAKEYIQILEDPHRVAHLQPEEILRKLNLKPGNVVADIGSGSGLFTRLMAGKVNPGGKVYAVDIDRDLLEHVSRTASEQGITNITTVLANPDSPDLPRAVLDMALICDTLHHIAKRELYLENLRPALKPGGRLAIIDFSDGWPAGHESLKYSLAELDRWTSAAGFVLEQQYDFIPGNFFRVYKKK
jgi:arsenite methyltransferase